MARRVEATAGGAPARRGDEELHELSRLRERLEEDSASRLRQLHRAIDLGSLELTPHVREPARGHPSVALPHGAWFRGAWMKKLARIVYDGSHEIGEELASALIETPAKSVGSYHSEPLPIADRIPL